MYYAFQDDDTLYIIMDYLSGGDLRYHICRRDYFTEEETKFIAACITLNLNYIHERNVIHRDLKPENLVFGGDGYLHLTDFGIAMEYHPGEEGVVSASGTPGYMAPEAIINKPHDFAVDYFALGVIVYELMMGERPYQGRNRKEIREQMFSIEIQLDNDDLPDDWEDANIIDFINCLLARKKRKRLGYKNFTDVRYHPWFKDIFWNQIENMTMNSPFVFDNEDNYDESYVQQQENDSIYDGKKELFIYEVNDSNYFKNFYFNIEDKILNQIEEKQKTPKETKTRTNFTSKTSNKKIGDDSEIVIHTFKNRNGKRKTAMFQSIQPDSDNKVIKLLRKNSKPASIKLNLNKLDDDL
jgi:serine/threonine protein kinase